MSRFKSIFCALILTFLVSQMVIATEVVNINTADAATIDRVLVGVGPTKAQAIVNYRKTHGAFKTVDALADVTGIGPSTLKRNTGRIALVNKAPRPAITSER